MNSFRFSVQLRFCFLIVTSPVLAALPGPLPSSAPEAAGFSAARLDVLHQNLHRLVDDEKYSGYIVLLARDGKIADWRAHGWADREHRVSMQKDTIVRIFSMTKIVTTVAVLTLLEEGRLKLTDPVMRYLPELRDPQVCVGGTPDAPILVEAKRPVTLLDLLTHTSGYCYDAPWSAEAPVLQLYERAKLWEAVSLGDFVYRAAKLPLHNQPGERFRYGINMDLLGAVVEKVSGQLLERFMQQRIFTPLGMHDTGFVMRPAQQTRLARVYTRDAAGSLVPDKVMNGSLAAPDRPFFSGGGGLFSTAADYARFAQMLLNGGELDGVRIVSRKTIELMTQDHLTGLADPHPFGAKSQGFGLGVRIMTDLGQSPVLGSAGCFGWDGAASTLVQIDPKERTVALLLLQHVPFNQDDIFALFENGYYSALLR